MVTVLSLKLSEQKIHLKSQKPLKKKNKAVVPVLSIAKDRLGQKKLILVGNEHIEIKIKYTLEKRIYVII